MQRTILGFHRDDEGDWVADLDCLHRQHVRHKPPIWPRPWVETEAGRAEHVGTTLDCPACGRQELPDDLEHVRTAGPFDQDSLPAGLRRTHVVADRTWGVLRVLEGEVTFHIDGRDVPLGAGDEQAIPPAVPHLLRLDGPVQLAVDFFVRPAPAPSG